jgi:hypothetical protein
VDARHGVEQSREKISPHCQEWYPTVQSTNCAYTIMEDNIKIEVKRVVRMSIEFDLG